MDGTPGHSLHAFPTALGACALRWSGAGIAAVLMPGAPRPGSREAPDRPNPPRPALGEAPDRRNPPRPALREAPDRPNPPAAITAAAEAISRLLEGERTDLRWIVLDTARVGVFARDVYAAAREIPAGETVSYGELARAAGHPGAAREVGAALARNPFPIVVPCHRVLAAGGALHGFSAPGGIATKRRMLEIEGAPGFEQQPLFA